MSQPEKNAPRTLDRVIDPLLPLILSSSPHLDPIPGFPPTTWDCAQLELLQKHLAGLILSSNNKHSIQPNLAAPPSTLAQQTLYISVPPPSAPSKPTDPPPLPNSQSSNFFVEFLE